MPSPLDTSVKFIASWMPGAPAIVSASVGGFLSAMDILVDGADERSGNINVSSGLATLTFTGGAHMATQHAVILVSGSGDVNLNGEQKVLTSVSGVITFPTNAANGTYTCTFKLAPMGWSRPFTGTNKRVYRSNDVTTEQMYLRIEHTANPNANVRMYRAMSDVNTGTDMIPDTATQATYDWTIRNSGAAGNAIYLIATDGKRIYAAIEWATNTTLNYVGGACHYFGPMLSRPEIVDPNNTVITGNISTSAASAGISCVGVGFGREYISKEYTGIGNFKPAIFALSGSGGTSSWSGGNSTNFGNTYPDPITGALFANEILVTGGNGIGTGGIRGKIPGILIAAQGVSGVFTSGNFVEINGKTYVVMRHCSSASTPQASSNGFFIDIEGPWV